REIQRHGLDVRGYMDILGELEAKRDQFYRQVKLPLKTSVGEVLLQELIWTSYTIRDLERDTNTVYPRNLTRDCSWCDYAPLCHAELRGEDTEYLLKHDY